MDWAKTTARRDDDKFAFGAAYIRDLTVSHVFSKTQPVRRCLAKFRFDLPYFSLQWRHNGRDGVSNHQPHHCLLNRLFRPRSKKTSKLRVTGLCAGNSPVAGEFPAQMASNTENVSTWWRDHVRTYAQSGVLLCVDVVWHWSILPMSFGVTSLALR